MLLKERLGNFNMDDTKLKDLVKDFFALLDIECESDSGRVYHPVTIGCSSVLYTRKLAEVLDKMKKAIE